MSTNHSFSVLCIVRASRSKQERLPIYLRITVDGRRSEISTKEYVEPAKWNSIKGRATGNTEPMRALNQRLEDWELKVRKHYSNFTRDEKPVTAKLLKEATLGFLDRQNTFFDYFEEYERLVGTKVGIDFVEKTHKNYLATSGHLKSFLEHKYRDRLVRLKDLDYDFIVKFNTYLRVECNNSNNGALKHVERVKKVVNEALKRGHLDKDPFFQFKAKKEKVTRQYLSEDELERIENYQSSKPHLMRIKDIFVFICYTGLTYQDLYDLTPDNIVLGLDGNRWISAIRNKTLVEISIPLLPPALEVLEKYEDYPESNNSGMLLPVLSNQKMNAYLKIIAADCGITKPVTCHIGRHTFATTVTLTNDIPIETVSKMLAHTTVRTTQIYSKVIKKKISKDMSKLSAIFDKKKRTA